MRYARTVPASWVVAAICYDNSLPPLDQDNRYTSYALIAYSDSVQGKKSKDQ